MKILRYKEKKFFLKLKKILDSRSEDISEEVDNVVKNIILNVKKEGDKALFKFSHDFDGIKLNSRNIKVIPKKNINKSKKVDPNILNAFKIAIKNLTEFHKKQLPKNYQINKNNIQIGSNWKPIESVGLYVPGGKASYPSSLIMSVIPAKIAGVKRIVVVNPKSNSEINPYIMHLLDILGINEIYQIGGAQAIAALTYGTKTIKPVNKIFGPGNAYVTSAKRQVFGKVGIDLIAGPSEIVVVADENNNSDWVASDLLAQAEHDEKAQSILITNSEKFSSKVLLSIDKLKNNLPKKNIINKSLNSFGAIIIVENIRDSYEIINLIAPEHLHLQNKDYLKIFKNIHNAGAVFLGEFSSEAFGDFIAGTNHILPTFGSSKFSSGLSVLDFLKNSSYVKMNKKSSFNYEGYVSKMAEIENLQAHKLSVKIRQKHKK